MVSLADITVPLPAKGHLRPVQAERDLAEVADLVELCFKDTLDPDGRSYIRQLRQASKGSPVLQWALSAAEAVNGLPISGYVWEEEGQVVGNLSLIPLHSQNQRIYLIANVAVHPNFRGRGIASMLTSTAVEYTRRRGAKAVWLQVRQDNSSARHVYQRLGFLELARRTTWIGESSGLLGTESPSGLQIGRRQTAHWAQQEKWLNVLYPAALRWHLPVKWWLIRPGIWESLQRFMNLEFADQWAVERDGRLLAVLTHHQDWGHTGTLWLAAPEPEHVDELAVRATLETARKTAGRRKPLSLNLPSGYAASAIQAAGFSIQQTLLWMRIELSPEMENSLNILR
jgi:ribosomal protein S18 acetylase RimI-like enzyme